MYGILAILAFVLICNRYQLNAQHMEAHKKRRPVGFITNIHPDNSEQE